MLFKALKLLRRLRMGKLVFIVSVIRLSGQGFCDVL